VPLSENKIVLVPLLFIKLLSSIKTIVPIVVNTILRTRTGEEWKLHRGRIKSEGRSENFQNDKRRNASKKVGSYRDRH